MPVSNSQTTQTSGGEVGIAQDNGQKYHGVQHDSVGAASNAAYTPEDLQRLHEEIMHRMAQAAQNVDARGGTTASVVSVTPDGFLRYTTVGDNPVVVARIENGQVVDIQLLNTAQNPEPIRPNIISHNLSPNHAQEALTAMRNNPGEFSGTLDLNQDGAFENGAKYVVFNASDGLFDNTYPDLKSPFYQERLEKIGNLTGVKLSKEINNENVFFAAAQGSDNPVVKRLMKEMEDKATEFINTGTQNALDSIEAGLNQKLQENGGQLTAQEAAEVAVKQADFYAGGNIRDNTSVGAVVIDGNNRPKETVTIINNDGNGLQGREFSSAARDAGVDAARNFTPGIAAARAASNAAEAPHASTKATGLEELTAELNGKLPPSMKAEITPDPKGRGYFIAVRDAQNNIVPVGAKQIATMTGIQNASMLQTGSDGKMFINAADMESTLRLRATAQATQTAPDTPSQPKPAATAPAEQQTAEQPVTPAASPVATPEAQAASAGNVAAVKSTLEKQMPGGLGVDVSAAEGGGYAISLTRSDGTPFPANQSTLGTVARYLNVRPEQLAVNAGTGTLTLTEAGFNASSTLRQASGAAEELAEPAAGVIARKAARSVSHVGGAVTAAVAAGVTGVSSLVFGHSPAEAAEAAIDASPASSVHAALDGRTAEAALRTIEEIPGGIVVTEALRGALQYFGADVDSSLTQLAISSGIQKLHSLGDAAMSALSANQWDERMSALREALHTNGTANTDEVIEKMNALYAQNPQAATLIAQAAYNNPAQAENLMIAYNEAIQQGITQTPQMAAQEAGSGEKTAAATPPQEGNAQQRA